MVNIALQKAANVPVHLTALPAQVQLLNLIAVHSSFESQFVSRLKYFMLMCILVCKHMEHPCGKQACWRQTSLFIMIITRTLSMSTENSNTFYIVHASCCKLTVSRVAADQPDICIASSGITWIGFGV